MTALKLRDLDLRIHASLRSSAIGAPVPPRSTEETKMKPQKEKP